MATDLEILFRGLGEQERTAFLAMGEPLAFAADEIILPAGRSEWDTYVIQEGEVSIWVGNACLGELQAGYTIGTSAILSPQLQWSAVRGKTAGVLLQVKREALMAFFESRPQRVFQQFCINLFRVWVEVLNRRNARVAQIQTQILRSASRRRKERFKLLVVDDEVEIRNVMQEFFKKDYDVVTAKDGREAVDLALTERPDLVLLDLRLPEMDGFSVCQRLKTQPQTDRVPILMISALDTTPDKVKGMMYGADEYLTKPVDLQQLAEMVSRVLDRAYGE